ncbi:MAG: PQQ-binding-like beta-propeller repeat protein [Deltaproteobacteria bacterium]|nr:PQQ-binding-like beta-propeller repeat protein [Deltaproteobacteria bacterium]
MLPLTRIVLFLAFSFANLFGCTVDRDQDKGHASNRSENSLVYPQYRLEPRHQGLSPSGAKLGPDLKVAWKSASLGIGDYTASKSSPAVDVDMVFVGADDGQLFALDRSDGSVIWSYQTHRYWVENENEESEHYGIHGSPAFDDCCVYIGDYSGYLYAIYKDSGKLKWGKRLGGSIGASPVLFDERIFIAVEFPNPDGKVFILDASDGSELYSTPFLGHHPHGSVSIDAEREYLFVGANNGLFYCFDFSREKEVWRFRSGGEIKSTAAINDDTVYFTSWDYKLHAIWIETGAERFGYRTQRGSMSSPSIYRDAIVFGSDDSYVYSIDAQSGRLRWKYQTGGIVLSSATIVQDSEVVLIGSRDEYVYMLTLDEGEVLWSADLDAQVSSVPVAVEDALYVNDDSGTVWCFTDRTSL